MSSSRRSLLVAAAGSIALAACGFRLRGPRALPFDTLFIGGAVDPELQHLIERRILASGSTRLTGAREAAAATLELLGAGREKTIIGLSGAGKVREYEFSQSLRFRLTARDGRELVPETILAATREATWNDAAILAKDQEEALLFADMHDELVRQLMRRLEAVHTAH